MKRKIYVDFDGVIWDTWPMLYKILKDNSTYLYDKLVSKSLTHEDNLEIVKIYQNNNWDLIIQNTSPIEGSLEALKELFETNMYDISILTHCNSDLEVSNKKKIIDEFIPGMQVIPVFKPKAKSEAVDARGAILIDDFSGNLDDWEEAGGIGIKFSLDDSNTNFHHVSSLFDIVKVIDEIEYESENSNADFDLIETAA